MVELGVREHGDPRRELQQRAVGLVGLDHEPLPLPPAGVGSGRADLAADQVARVHPAPAQRVHDHARGRRLAVGAADRDRRLQPGQLAEQLGAVQLALAALAGDRALGVLGRDRAGDHDLGALGHVGGVVARRPARPRARAAARGSSEPPVRSEPVTVAPSERATSARPLMPAPPIPTKCSARPLQGWVVLTAGEPSDRLHARGPAARYGRPMTVRLHRCSNVWVKVSGHPCWKVQKALDEAGIGVRDRQGPAAAGQARRRRAPERPAQVPRDRVRGRLGLPRGVRRTWRRRSPPGSWTPSERRPRRRRPPDSRAGAASRRAEVRRARPGPAPGAELARDRRARPR